MTSKLRTSVGSYHAETLRVFAYGNTNISYRLTYTERETLAIHVHPDTRVTVEAPHGSDLAEIEKRLHKKAAWIVRQQRDFRRYSPDFPPRLYVSGETHRYLGRQYRLKVIQAEAGKESVLMDREQILVTVRDKTHVKQRLDDWYHRRAHELFAECVAAWFPHFERFGIVQPQVAVRAMRSRWGSCTAHGKLTFNLKLIQAPRQLVDYIIVHEMCHLVEHNHSGEFYALLSRVMPDWEVRREQLNTMEF
jgi:predicted metal-dependent hydrolase